MSKLILRTRIAKRFNPMDRFLVKALNSDCIHSELVFPDGINLACEGMSFSSRGRVKDVTPRIRGTYFADVDYSKGKWVDIQLERITTSNNIWDVFRKADSIAGSKYDTLGAILNAGYGFNVDKKNKYWCSEAVACVILKYYPELGTDNVTPYKLKTTIERCNRMDG